VIVVVETNFILELAFMQAEAEHAKAILELAEAEEIELVVPTVAFAECHAKLAAQSKKRNVLLSEIRTEIKQIARSRGFAELEQTSKGITDALVSSGALYASQLDKVSHRFRACAHLIPLTPDMIGDVSGLELAFDLLPGDLFIYASLNRYLAERAGAPSLFVTKDKDFEQTAASLQARGCQLIFGFAAAYAALKRSPT